MKFDNVISVGINKTVYRDGDHAIKVFDADYSKADVLNEALNQARVEETGLNIPKACKEISFVNAIVLDSLLDAYTSLEAVDCLNKIFKLFGIILTAKSEVICYFSASCKGAVYKCF